MALPPNASLSGPFGALTRSAQGSPRAYARLSLLRCHSSFCKLHNWLVDVSCLGDGENETLSNWGNYPGKLLQFFSNRISRCSWAFQPLHRFSNATRSIRSVKSPV